MLRQSFLFYEAAGLLSVFLDQSSSCALLSKMTNLEQMDQEAVVQILQSVTMYNKPVTRYYLKGMAYFEAGLFISKGCALQYVRTEGFLG